MKTFSQLAHREKFQFNDRGAPLQGEWIKTGRYKATQGTAFVLIDENVKVAESLKMSGRNEREYVRG